MRSVVLFILALLIPACLPARASSATVISSGLDVSTGFSESVTVYYWLDDRTLFFGAKIRTSAPNERPRVKPTLFLWKMGGKPSPYAEGVSRWQDVDTYYCAADGEAFYPIGRREDVQSGDIFIEYLRGTPGSEKITWRTIKRGVGQPAFEGTSPINRIGPLGGRPCGFSNDESMRGHLWASDFGNKFYLDFGLNGSPLARPINPPVLLKADKSLHAELPIHASDVVPECSQYDRRTDRFVVWNCIASADGPQQRWKAGNCWPYWQIAPLSGRVFSGCIPYGAWSQVIDGLLLTRTGIYFTSSSMVRNDDLSHPRVAGLYRLGEHEVTRVAPGVFLSPSVSPDGCKIAFTFASNLARRDLTAAFVNVCDDR